MSHGRLDTVGGGAKVSRMWNPFKKQDQALVEAKNVARLRAKMRKKPEPSMTRNVVIVEPAVETHSKRILEKLDALRLAMAVADEALFSLEKALADASKFRTVDEKGNILS